MGVRFPPILGGSGAAAILAALPPGGAGSPPGGGAVPFGAGLPCGNPALVEGRFGLGVDPDPDPPTVGGVLVAAGFDSDPGSVSLAAPVVAGTSVLGLGDTASITLSLTNPSM